MIFGSKLCGEVEELFERLRESVVNVAQRVDSIANGRNDGWREFSRTKRISRIIARTHDSRGSLFVLRRDRRGQDRGEFVF